MRKNKFKVAATVNADGICNFNCEVPHSAVGQKEMCPDDKMLPLKDSCLRKCKFV